MFTSDIPLARDHRRIFSVTGQRRILPPIHPNAGVDMAYRRKLDRLICEMNRSIVYWLTVQYNKNPPELASDASPASDFDDEMRKLGDRWQSRFDRAAKEMADHFAHSAFSRADGRLRTILGDAGWTVKFRTTRAVNDILQATISANVDLIKSIASEHLTDVKGIVMRGVQQGRSQSIIVKDIEAKYGLTRKRASLIARDQNNKATAAITRARQQELGITHAIWMHSNAGREPRPKHVAFAAGRLGGPVYEISKGAQIGDKGEFTHPGVEINCRCFSRPVLPGLDD